jgi:hypothetical protein
LIREPFTKRCLVPATGWCEWQKLDAKKKRPIHMCANTTPFAFKPRAKRFDQASRNVLLCEQCHINVREQPVLLIM